MRSIILYSLAIMCAGQLLAGECDECAGKSKSLFGLSCCGESEDPGFLFRWRCQKANSGVDGLDEKLVSDRPDFTEASSVVGLRVLQIESGYTYFYDHDGTDRTIRHSYPETLFRYGILANWLELRIGSNFASQRVNADRSSGAEDLYLGLKLGLTAQDGLRPEMAIVPQMTVPSGGSAFTKDDVLPGINWLYGWDISDCLATGGSTQWNREIDEQSGRSFNEWAQSWTINYSLSKRLGAFTEWFAIFPADADFARTQQYVDGGFTYSITNDIQWDIRAGKGINDVADDYFFGSGLVLRFK